MNTRLVSILLLLAYGGSAAAYSDPATQLLIDTDPAMGYLFQDIDDGLMLLMALGSSEIDVIGITTVAGNVSHRRAAAKAIEIVQTAGATTVPVVAGPSPERDGHETSDEVAFVVDTIRSRPGEVTILASGPLTNIAAALTRSPDIANLIRELVVVGGRVEGLTGSTKRMPYDLNFGSDPEAVRVVFDSGVNLTIIHIELCLEFRTTPNQFRDLFRDNTDLSRYIRRTTASWRLVKFGRIVLWDVVALSWIAHPEWFTAEAVTADLVVSETRRPTITIVPKIGATRTVTSPLGMADKSAYWTWITESVTR